MTWTLTGATLDTGNQVSVSTTGNPRGLFFKPDGLKMFVGRRGVPGVNNLVYEYHLTSAWDLTTATYSGVSFNTNIPGAGTATGLAFSSDGTKMYVPNTDNQTIYQYTLSTPWDISTAAIAAGVSKGVGVQMSDIKALFFRDDGTRVYVLGGPDRAFQYTLGTAWNISTASYDTQFVAGPGSSTGLAFGPDGKVVFMLGVGTTPDVIVEKDLPTAWALVSIGSGPTLTSNTDNGGALAVSDDTNAKLFHVDFSTLIVYRWSVGVTTPTSGWVVGATSFV